MEKQKDKFYCSLSYQTIPESWEEDGDSGWVFSFQKKTLEEIVQVVFDYGLYYDEEDSQNLGIWATTFPQKDELFNIPCHYCLFVKKQDGSEISAANIEEINNRISYMDDLLFN